MEIYRKEYRKEYYIKNIEKFRNYYDDNKENILEYEKIWDLDLELKPVYLGAIMKASENNPPGMNRFK